LIKLFLKNKHCSAEVNRCSILNSEIQLIYSFPIFGTKYIEFLSVYMSILGKQAEKRQ